jgi:uncharacterized DUF497 family protein
LVVTADLDLFTLQSRGIDSPNFNLWMGGINFEWDEKKSSANMRKHGISFDEARTVFGDPLSLTVRDPDHDSDEERFVTIGHSVRSRLLIVVHTVRGLNIRLISARSATKYEKRDYEKAYH